jgi:hypothetical protein
MSTHQRDRATDQQTCRRSFMPHNHAFASDAVQRRALHGAAQRERYASSKMSLIVFPDEG